MGNIFSNIWIRWKLFIFAPFVSLAPWLVVLRMFGRRCWPTGWIGGARIGRGSSGGIRTRSNLPRSSRNWGGPSAAPGVVTPLRPLTIHTIRSLLLTAPVPSGTKSTRLRRRLLLWYRQRRDWLQWHLWVAENIFRHR